MYLRNNSTHKMVAIYQKVLFIATTKPVVLIFVHGSAKKDSFVKLEIDRLFIATEKPVELCFMLG